MVKISPQAIETAAPDDELWGDNPAKPAATTRDWAKPAITTPPEQPAGGPMLEPNEILCPLTGEITEIDNVDGLVDMLERLNEVDAKIYATKLAIRKSLAALTEGDAKTRRVRGARRQAVVEMPGDSYEQSVLKECWAEYQDLRDQVLKIDTIGVKAREYKKLVNTSGDTRFNQFRDAVARANRGPTGVPTVKIET